MASRRTPNQIADHLAALQARTQRPALTPTPIPPPPRTRFSLRWTGLHDKTLWDWLSLLLVPLLIGLGTIWVTNQQTIAQNTLSQQLHDRDERQHESDQRIASQARQDDLLTTYRDSIDTLILSNGLKTSRQGNEVRQVAHSRTLDILRQIDGPRKGLVIAYLMDQKLIQTTRKEHSPILSLTGADLSKADLKGADLRGALQLHFFGSTLTPHIS